MGIASNWQGKISFISEKGTARSEFDNHLSIPSFPLKVEKKVGYKSLDYFFPVCG